MRWVVGLLSCVLAGPAAGWEFSPLPVCTLTHEGAGAVLRITRDPGLAEPYELSIARAAGWSESPGLAIRFDGPRALTIGTDRHRLSEDGTTLSVTDRGFGNVLDGLEFNATATALAGGDAVVFNLEDAAEPVRAFRDCREAPLS